MRATQIALATAFLLAGSGDRASATCGPSRCSSACLDGSARESACRSRLWRRQLHSQSTTIQWRANRRGEFECRSGRRHRRRVSLQDLLNPYPSLPFSNNQNAYNNRQLAVMAAIDPITQFQIAQAERLLKLNPITTGGFAYFVPSEPYAISEPAPQPQQQPAPQIIVLQQAAPAVQPSTSAQFFRASTSSASAPSSSSRRRRIRPDKTRWRANPGRSLHPPGRPHRLHHPTRPPPLAPSDRPRPRSHRTSQRRPRHPHPPPPLIRAGFSP